MTSKLVNVLIAVFSIAMANAQITVDNSPTPTDLVTNTLIGPGVTVSNITYTGQASQRGYFNGSGSNIGIAEGVMLSSGNVTDCVPPNQPSVGQFAAAGDPDLLTVAQSVTTNPDASLITSTNDAAILEFDFIPDGNTVTFNFVFASEEYTTYINTQFNDAFGFFVSGPGITGPFSSPAGFPNGAVNLALVPGTSDPITISTIHPGLNASYYIGTPVGHTFNGFTTPIQISFDVICDETYHFKFAVTDCQDDWLDTGVFLEAGSFNSIPVQLGFQTFTLDSVTYEGCNELATILFTRPECQSIDSLVVDVAVGGTATNGVDYVNLPDSVYFPPNVDTVFWQLIPFEDGLAEGIESVTLTVTTILNNGDTIYETATLYISDVPEIFPNGVDQDLFCYTDSTIITANPSGGFAPYTYQWSTGDTTQNSTVLLSGNGTTEYYLTVTDLCGYEGVDTVTVVMNQTLSIDSFAMQPATCNPVGSIVTFLDSIRPNTTFDWTYQGDTAFVWPDQNSLNNLYGGWYILEYTDNDIPCTVIDSVYVETINTPQAIATVTPNYGCAPLIVTISNSSNNSSNYVWDFGNGNTLTTTSTANLVETYYADAVIQLTASNGDPNCNSTASLIIDIIECGCMNPQALNYNPNAVMEDGSCIFPTPTAEAPNVITLNGDQINEFFFLKTQYAEAIELTILNRWGNTIYHGAGDEVTPPFWDGRDKSGNIVTDGVYFYRYKITGIMGDELEGHGFVEVVK